MPQKRVSSIDELKNLYFMYGDEEWLAQEALSRLQGLLAKEVDPDFNLEVLDASTVGADQVIDAAETVPLLSSRRLVVVREADKLNRKEQEKLAAYLSNCNPATTLVLVAHFPGTGENKDKAALKRAEGTPLFKAAKQNGEVLKLTLSGKGKHERLDTWVNEQFRKRGKRCEAGARELLVGKVGSDLRELADAIERVCLYTEDKTVQPEDVRSVVAPVAEQGMFEFVDAVADRRRDVALFLLNRLLRQGENPQRLFNMLLRQFRLIARAKSLEAEHDYQGLADALGVHPYVASKCARQARRYSPDRLRSLFGEFKRTQVELHSSKYLSEREYQGSVLELLVVKIIG